MPGFAHNGEDALDAMNLSQDSDSYQMTAGEMQLLNCCPVWNDQLND